MPPLRYAASRRIASPAPPRNGHRCAIGRGGRATAHQPRRQRMRREGNMWANMNKKRTITCSRSYGAASQRRVLELRLPFPAAAYEAATANVAATRQLGGRSTDGPCLKALRLPASPAVLSTFIRPSHSLGRARLQTNTRPRDRVNAKVRLDSFFECKVPHSGITLQRHLAPVDQVHTSPPALSRA